MPVSSPGCETVAAEDARRGAHRRHGAAEGRGGEGRPVRRDGDHGRESRLGLAEPVGRPHRWRSRRDYRLFLLASASSRLSSSMTTSSIRRRAPRQVITSSAPSSRSRSSARWLSCTAPSCRRARRDLDDPGSRGLRGRIPASTTSRTEAPCSTTTPALLAFPAALILLCSAPVILWRTRRVAEAGDVATRSGR